VLDSSLAPVPSVLRAARVQPSIHLFLVSSVYALAPLLSRFSLTASQANGPKGTPGAVSFQGTEDNKIANELY
jgi:hypothetical protein